jgi:hypothetical protein
MGRGRTLFVLAALLSAPTAAAEPTPGGERFDLAVWALSLDPDRPAGGPYVVYMDSASPPSEDLDPLRRSLFSLDPRLGGPAVEALTARGAPHGEAVLLEAARSERWGALDAPLRAEIVRALLTLRSGRALSVFARVALEESGKPAREAIRALCESMAPEAVPVLRALAGGRDAAKRNLVVRYLRKTGEREATRQARELRRDARQDRRREVREDRRERREERRERRGRKDDYSSQ